MARTEDADEPDAVLFVRLPPALLAQLDALVESERRTRGKISRAAIVREIVARFLAQRAAGG